MGECARAVRDDLGYTDAGRYRHRASGTETLVPVRSGCVGISVLVCSGADGGLQHGDGRVSTRLDSSPLGANSRGCSHDRRRVCRCVFSHDSCISQVRSSQERSNVSLAIERERSSNRTEPTRLWPERRAALSPVSVILVQPRRTPASGRRQTTASDRTTAPRQGSCFWLCRSNPRGREGRFWRPFRHLSARFGTGRE